MNHEDLIPGQWVCYRLLRRGCLQKVPAIVITLYPERIGIAIPYGEGPQWNPMVVTPRFLEPMMIGSWKK